MNGDGILRVAQYMRTLPAHRPGQNQALYEMDPPLEGARYVVASAIPPRELPFTDTPLGVRQLPPEVYLFRADELGGVVSWDDLPGSVKETMRHEDAFAAAGYVVATDEQVT